MKKWLRNIVLASVLLGSVSGIVLGAEPRTLRVALAGLEESNFDPKFTGAATIMRVSVPIYDFLTLLTVKFEVVPGLAERWDISPDGRTYTFHLRAGVQFHNGDPVTSEDVKFSFTRQMAKDSKNTIAGTIRGLIESIDTPNTSTVVMRLKRAAPDLLLIISPYQGGVPIVPSRYMTTAGDRFATAPIGSGPFKVIAHDPGVRIEYQAVPNHWRAQPGFDRLVLLAVPEESSRIAMLQRGEADMAEISVAREAELLAKGMRVTNVPRVLQFGIFYYGSWVDPKSPLADIRVRKALAYAVNYDAIIKGVLLGRGERSLPWGIFPGAAYADPHRASQAPIPYDPQKARALLREAGYPNGFTLKLHSASASAAPYLPKVAEVVASDWKRVGVDTQIVPVDIGAFRAMYRGRDPRLNGTATVFRYPAIFDGDWSCEDGLNVRTNSSQPLHNDKRIDALCEDAIKEANPSLRAEKMKLVFDALDREVFFGFTIAYGSSLVAWNPKTIADWTPIQSYIDLGPDYERIQPSH